MDEDEIKTKKLWHELYLELLANPFDDRTDVEFCKENALNYTTLSRWKSKYRSQIYAEANKRRKEYVSELRTKNFKAIANSIKDSFNDRKLLAQLLGDLIERTENKTELMTEDDKRRRVKTLLENIQKKKSAWGEPDESETQSDVPSIQEGSSTPKTDGNGDS